MLVVIGSTTFAQLIGPPPQNFNAAYFKGIGVQCGWQPPTQNTEWLGYDDGVNVDGLGINGGGTFLGAIRWEPADLTAYDGWYLTMFDFFPRLFQNQSDFTFMIWEGANASNLIYQQEVTGIIWDEWNEILIDEIHLIDASKELWIGFEVTNPDAESPLGYDQSPAIAGYGDMVSVNGTTWQSMSIEWGLDYNFNLHGYITDTKKGEPGKKEILTQKTIHNPKGQLVKGNLKPVNNGVSNRGDRDLMGYNVYRNGSQVNPDLILGLSFTDAFFTQGTYMYNAKAVYTDGLSDQSNSVEITIMEYDPDIAVTPTTLNEVHANPPQVTTRTLTISNSGVAPLHWEMATSTLCFNYSDKPKIEPDEYAGLLAKRQAQEAFANKTPQTISIPQQIKPGPYDNPESGLCTDALYTSGCQLGDGIIWWNLENVFIPDIPCSGTPDWYHDYTDQIHLLPAGDSYTLTVKAGYDDTYFDVWIDFNDDLLLTEDELIINNGICEYAENTYIFEAIIPIDALPGTHLLRFRTNWTDEVTDPCETYAYGNCGDFMAVTDGGIGEDWYYASPTSGTVAPGETNFMDVTFSSLNLPGGIHNGLINILSNDPDEPLVAVPVTLNVQSEPPLMADFSAEPLTGLAPLSVAFTDLSTGNATQWEWDFDNDGLVDSYDQNPTHIYTQEGVYSVKLTIYSLTDNSAFKLIEDYITVTPNNNYFEPVWVSPFNPMTFYIVGANIDEAPMQAGDEVGLFDIDPTTGQEICVGSGTLTEQLGGGTYLEVIASMDDGSNPEQANGFTPGNTIIYKLWSEVTGEISSITANYPYPGYDEVYTSQGSAFVELNGVTYIEQCIELATGWNIMSFRAMPENPDMLNIVQPLINDEILYKVLNEAGGSVFHLPFPPPNGQWSNTIGDMESTEGYYIKVEDNGTLCIEGLPVETPMDIPLSQGWNIMGYPCENPQNALTAVQPLINDDVLYKVIDEAGGTIFHLPFPPPNGQWSNTIGAFESGEGYYIKVTENTSLTMECPVEFTEVITPPQERIQLTFFHPIYENNPYMPMHIVLNPCDDLQNGDEIGIFDGTTCVGAKVTNGNVHTPVIIPVSQNDPQSDIIDGYNPGNTISIMIWNNQTGNVSEVQYKYIEGDETFSPLETMIGDMLPIITETEDVNIGDVNFKVIPNPFSRKTNAILFMKEGGEVKMHVQNMSGVELMNLPTQSFNKGNQSIEIDLDELGSGVYFLLIEIQYETVTDHYIEKLIKL